MKSFLQHEIIWLNIHFYPSVFIFILTFWLNFLLESINLLLFINTYNYWFFYWTNILTFLVLKTFFIVQKKTLTTPHLFFELKKITSSSGVENHLSFCFYLHLFLFFLGLGHSNFFFSNFKYFWIIIYKKNHNIFLFFNSLIYF